MTKHWLVGRARRAMSVRLDGSVTSGDTGWFAWSDDLPDEATREARRAEFEPLAAADEPQRERRRSARFGAPGEVTVFQRSMPLSGHLFEWRTDGFWRTQSREAQMDTDFETEWTAWSESHDLYGAGEVAPGDRHEATWWLRWGEAAPESEVSCWLADDRDVPVIRLGGLWICEYLSLSLTFIVKIEDTVLELVVRRPGYLPPAPHPFSRNSTNPQA